MNRLRQDQIGTDTEGLGHPRLSFHHRDRQRSLVRIRISCALEQQRCVLLVVTVDDDRVEMLGHQSFDRSKRLVAGLDMEFQFIQDLADYAGRFFVRAE